jgi:NAD(P)-dependent dehydrogenase (short-subunit alcohol dehydrogenase family)
MTDSLLGLQGKSALILGGGQGMGESTALLLARAGCNVGVLDIISERAERVAAAVAEKGPRGVPYVADVTDDAALVAAIGKADRDFGHLDGMVAIVGMARWATLINMPLESWDLDHRRNIRYFFLAARTLAARMLEKGRSGSIVCITSMDGLVSAPYHASYGAAKAGLVNLVRSMAEEWSASGVRVNAIAPGAIITPRIPRKPPEQENAMTRRIPIRRRGTTDEIGKAALFLLSDLASYVTGHTLAVDGGFTAVGALDYGDLIKTIPATGATLGMQDA